jgi:hypothetical protein
LGTAAVNKSTASHSVVANYEQVLRINDKHQLSRKKVIPTKKKGGTR